MIPTDFLLSTVILGDSGGGGNYIFFIIIVLITVISKIISWYKNRETSTEMDDRSYDEPPRNAQEAIRRAIREQQIKGKVSPPVPGAYMEGGTAPARQQSPVTSTWPQQQQENTTETMPPFEYDSAYSNSTPAQSKQSTDIEQAQLHTNVEALAASIERDAQKAIDHAYASAESSYKQTMEQLTNSTNRAKVIAQAALKKAAPAIDTMELKTPGMLKKAVIMSEILATPKGLKKN